MPSPIRRSRRTKQVSSIDDMFSKDNEVSTAMCNDDTKLLNPVNSTTSYTTDTITLKDMALRLRRAKRSLLLSAVSMDRPVSPSESLRTIMNHLSSSEFIMGSSSASMDGGSTVSTMSSIADEAQDWMNRSNTPPSEHAFAFFPYIYPFIITSWTAETFPIGVVERTQYAYCYITFRELSTNNWSIRTLVDEHL